MYNTLRELYTAIDIESQLISSSRRRAIPREQLDFIINKKLVSYIDNKVSSYTNNVKEGFEDSSKRLSDLLEFKSEFTTTSIIKGDYSYIDLPPDFKMIYPSQVDLIFDCNNKADIQKYYRNECTIEFPDDYTGINNKYYTNFKLTLHNVFTGAQNLIFDISNYSTDLYSTDSKFMIISNLINRKDNSIFIYYSNNTFKIIDFNNLYTNATITYNSLNINKKFDKVEYSTYIGDTINRPIEILPEDKFVQLSQNYYYIKNRQNKPLSYIKDNKLFVYNKPNLYVSNIKLNYIALPIFVNKYTDTMTNMRLGLTELVSLVVEEIYAILSGSYEASINKNNKIN